ncbi:MAG: hypothetical protein AAB552_01355 [Patescibacteria group bacterium]
MANFENVPRIKLSAHDKAIREIHGVLNDGVLPEPKSIEEINNLFPERRQVPREKVGEIIPDSATTNTAKQPPKWTYADHSSKDS